MSPEMIAALGGVLATLIGGIEMRLAISRLHAKVDRLEERLGTVERRAEKPCAPSAELAR